LIVGGGCRGLRLAGDAVGEGHAVRIVTRTEAGRGAVEAVGAECWIGDPDRLGTLRGALESVTIACWLLGSASGPEEQLRALHGPRLRAFLGHATDTTVRGVVYEAAGTAAGELLAAGELIAAEVAGANAMPLAILGADPHDLPAWLEQARAAVDSLLHSAPRALDRDTLS
jgi:hypothetical protein